MKINIRIGLTDDTKAFLQKLFGIDDTPGNPVLERAIEKKVAEIAKENAPSEVISNMTLNGAIVKTINDIAEEIPKTRKRRTQAEIANDKAAIDPADQEQPEIEVKPETAAKSEPAKAEAEELNIDGVRTILKPIMDKGGFDKIQKAFKTLGASSLSTVKKEDYQKLLDIVLA